jgi:spermidine/putrescine transport system ATP-binding protein
MEKKSKSQILSLVADALEMVQLQGLEKRYPRQLSGGQQQRVALARSLIKRPKVLLLDEPLGALDLKLRKDMQLELKHVQQQVGITFIYVTHDQEEALTMSDRIAVMSQGQILQLGTPMEIYEEPNSRFVADFIGETNFLTGKVIKQKGEETTILIDETLPITVAYRDRLAVGQQVTLVVRPEKIAISSLQQSDRPGWTARIQEAVYIGTDTRYLVRLTEKTVITIRQQNLYRSHIHFYRSGEQIQINIAPENIRLIL